MKTTLLILSLLGIGANAFAGERDYLYCENGSIAKVGDAHYAINVFEDGFEFLPYEGSFLIDAADAPYVNGTHLIKNVKAELMMEGEPSQVVVNGSIKISKDRTKLAAKIKIGGSPVRSLNMSCVKKGF